MSPGVKNARCRDAYVNGYFGAPCEFAELCEATQNKLVLNDVEATTVLLRYAILTLHESAVKSLRRRRRSVALAHLPALGRFVAMKTGRTRGGGVRAQARRRGRTIWRVQKAQN